MACCPAAHPTSPGATASTLAGIAHADLPAHLDLTSLAGLPAGARVLYVTGPYVPPWPDTTIPTLDLTAPGLPDTAFDTSALAAAAWPVARAAAVPRRLPGRRPRDPRAGVRGPAHSGDHRGRGRRRKRPAGGARPGRCGHRAARGDRPPVAGLVLLGASDAAVPLDVLDQPPTADALALARRLLPDDASHDGADLAAARSVIGLLGELFDATHDPAVDLTPPAGLSALRGADLVGPRVDRRGQPDARARRDGGRGARRLPARHRHPR